MITFVADGQTDGRTELNLEDPTWVQKVDEKKLAKLISEFWNISDSEVEQVLTSTLQLVS